MENIGDLENRVENAKSYNEVFDALYATEREDILNDGGFCERGYVENRCIMRIIAVNDYNDAVTILRNFQQLDPDADIYRRTNDLFESYEDCSLDDVKEYTLDVLENERENTSEIEI